MTAPNRPYLLIASLLLNSVLLGSLLFVVQQLGGWNYTLQRMRQEGAGPYAARRSLFAELPPKPGAVVFVGDSQVEQGEWSELLPDTLPVLNRGLVSDHVDGVYQRLDEVLRHRPRRVVLLVGLNDLIYGKPVPEVEAKYREIVQKIRRDAPSARVSIVSVLPVNNEVRETGTNNTPILRLNAGLRQLAQATGARYVDAFSKLKDPNGNLAREFTEDGIHLNGPGYRVLADVIGGRR